MCGEKAVSISLSIIQSNAICQTISLGPQRDRSRVEIRQSALPSGLFLRLTSSFSYFGAVYVCLCGHILPMLWGHESVSTVTSWGLPYLMGTRPHNVNQEVIRWVKVMFRSRFRLRF